MRLVCAIFLIFIAFCKGDNGKVEADFEDAKEMLPNRTYYWKNWRFCEDKSEDLHVWSEAVALRFFKYSYGFFDFIIDNKLWIMQYSDVKRYNRTDSGWMNCRFDFSNKNFHLNGKLIGGMVFFADYQDGLQIVKIMSNSTIQAQPILSHAGSTKLVFGEWFLVSRNEGEISIQHGNAPLVITIREDIRSFTVESEATNQTFTATTLLGAEFSTSWISRRKINQSNITAEAHKSETEQHSNVTGCSKLASCSTSNRNNSNNGWTEIRCYNRVQLHNISYLWDFDRLDLYRPKDNANKIIRSPSFSSATYDRIEWYLELELGYKTSENISLYLCRCLKSTETEALADVNVYFLDSEGNLMHKIVERTFDTYSDDTDNCWGWDDIPSKKVVSPDNRLRIVCTIAVCEFTTTAFHLNRTNLRINPEYNFSQNIIHSSITNSDDSDVVLVLSKTGKEYPANKLVLASSSPRFATMFNISRTEKNEKIDRVNITDVDSEPVMDELLKYIETSKCENIETLAHDLLVAAQKYELYNLTELCIEKIANNLTVGNAVDTLNLADKHGFDKLKSKTIRFIAANYAQVSNTSDWKHVVKTKNGEFFHEVCQLLSNQSSNKKNNEV